MEQSPASGHVAAACMRRIALPGLPAHDALRTAGRGQGRVAEEAASGKANRPNSFIKPQVFYFSFF